MTTGEIIKNLCANKGISISKLEKDLGFSNGSILKRDVMLSDRLLKVANYFGVTMEFLMGEETRYYINPETADVAQQIFENKEMRMLFDASRDASPEDLKTVHSMLLALKRKERNNEE